MSAVELQACSPRGARVCRAQGVTVPATDLRVYACARIHGAEIEQCDEHFEVIRRAAGH